MQPLTARGYRTRVVRPTVTAQPLLRARVCARVCVRVCVRTAGAEVRVLEAGARLACVRARVRLCDYCATIV